MCFNIGGLAATALEANSIGNGRFSEERYALYTGVRALR